MSKKNIKIETEVAEMENTDNVIEIMENPVVDEVVKAKWSLKKKLMIGGGVVVGLILGAVALGSKNTTTRADEILAEAESEDLDEDETESTGTPENDNTTE